MGGWLGKVADLRARSKTYRREVRMPMRVRMLTINNTYIIIVLYDVFTFLFL